MKINQLKNIKSLLFSSKDVADALGITNASARVTCHRYVKKGVFVRPKRNVYVLSERWERLDRSQAYAIANRLQVPSYVSFTTALSFHEITTQVQQNFFESAAVFRTKRVEIKSAVFQYFKLQKRLYFGFIKKDNFFIATPEKAFLDSIYLMALKRYRLDIDGCDLRKLDYGKLRRLLGDFPAYAGEFFKKIWKTSSNTNNSR